MPEIERIRLDFPDELNQLAEWRIHPGFDGIADNPEVDFLEEVQVLRMDDEDWIPGPEWIAASHIRQKALKIREADYAFRSCQKQISQYGSLPCFFCSKPITILEKFRIVKNSAVHEECAVKSFSCYICILIFPLEQGKAIKKGLVCKDCFASAIFCPCGELASAAYDDPMYLDNTAYCRNCAKYCNTCDQILKIEDVFWYQGSFWCHPCADSKRWVRNHYFDPMKVLEFKGNPRNGLFFGVELEVETPGIEQKAVAAKALSIGLQDWAIIKHDGSLQDGFEIVSAPMSLEEHYKSWDEYFKIVDNSENPLSLESYNSTRCSMHVHMSREALTIMQQARMAVFVYSRKTMGLIESIAGRNLHDGWGEYYATINHKAKLTYIAGVFGSKIWAYQQMFGDRWKEKLNQELSFDDKASIDYCMTQRFEKSKSKGKKEFMKKPFIVGERARYSALNDTNPNTIELRIFRGCNKRSTILKNLEFCQSLVDYCAPGKISLSQFEEPSQYLDFVEYHRKQYPHLIRFLTRHGFITLAKKVKV